jgi:hypothetical protein
MKGKRTKMSEQSSAKKKYWVSTFYWMKPPKQPSPLRTGFANKEQKRLYVIMTAFKIAQFAAIVVVALFLLGILG